MHPRILSGQIDSLAGLGRGLVRRGHEVDLVAPFDVTGLLDRDLVVLDGGPRGLVPAARSMLGTVPRLIQAARGCDLVHLALPTPAFGWLADLVQIRAGVPTIASFEGHLAHAGQFLRVLRHPVSVRSYLPLCGVNNRLFGRISFHRCDAYIVGSDYQRDELVALGYPPDRIAVLPNVVEDGKLGTCEPRLARRLLRLPLDRPIVGYVGHFTDVKGVDVLADAFRTVAESVPDAMLALAWSGQGDDALIRRRLAGLEDRVIWLSKVHVGTFLCALDVLALPYRSTAGQGAYPSLVLEALHVGRPLVTTDLPLLREITNRGDVALTCPPERADLLAANVATLLGSEQQRRRMAQTQRQLARDRFASSVLLPRYEALYASVLGVGAEAIPDVLERLEVAA
jgi:glycosyltransferase involved in cell wall biosynthesis